MSRIIQVSQAVRDAVAGSPGLVQVVDRIRDEHIPARFRRHRDEPKKLAIGDSTRYGGSQVQPRWSATPNGGDCPVPPVIPGCFGKDNRRLCDMTRLSRGIIVTAGSAFTLQMEPTNANWFEPLAVRCDIIDAENSDIRHAVLFTDVRVSTNAIEATAVAAPVAPALVNLTAFDGWLSDDWQDPSSYAVGVSWPKFSDAAGKQALFISGGAFFLPAGTIVAAIVTIYGNAGRNAPPS